jgi:predicted MFS family arabinose efflux permease
MLANYLSAVRSFDRNVRLLLIAVCLEKVGYPGMFALLFNLYLARLGYGAEFIGLVNGTGILLYAAVCLPTGPLIRRWGARTSLIVGLASSASGMALAPFGEFLPEPWRAAWLMTCFSIAWFTAAPYIISLAPYLMSVTDVQNRNHVLSVWSAITPAAVFVGSLIGGALPGIFAWVFNTTDADPAIFRYSLWVASGIFLLSIPVMLRTSKGDERIETSSSTGAAAASPLLLIAVITFASILMNSGESIGKSFFNLYLDARLFVPVAQIGVIMAVGQLLAIPATLSIAVISHRWSRERIIFGGMLFSGLCLIPLALIPHWAAAALAYMALITLTSVARPVLLFYAQEAVTLDWRTTVSSAMSMAYGVNLAVISTGGGYIIANLGYPLYYLIGAALAVCGALFFWYFVAAPRRPRDISTQPATLG